MESNYINVYTGNTIIAQLIISRLNDIGINPIVKDETESGRLAGFGASIQNQKELFVHNDEHEKAIPIIESILAEMAS